jgi:hypothetical protein
MISKNTKSTLQQWTQAVACVYCCAYFPSNSIMHNTIQLGECQPAVPKHAAPLDADIFESTIMLQTAFASESLRVAAYFLG